MCSCTGSGGCHNQSVVCRANSLSLAEADDAMVLCAAAKAVKTATMQTEVVDGFQILRSARCNETMRYLADWSKALSRKYGPLTVSAQTEMTACSLQCSILMLVLFFESMHLDSDSCL